MAQRLNRFDESKNTETPKLEDTLDFGPEIEEIAKLLDKQQDEKLQQSTQEQFEKTIKKKKMLIVVILILIILFGLLGAKLCIKMNDESKKPMPITTTEVQQVKEIDTAKVLDSINQYLAEIYNDNYQILSDINVTGEFENPIVNDLEIQLTSADNSPKLIASFSLEYNQESDAYHVISYTINDSIY